ncbi:MarR family transcriptional regulator (plasmid) [Vibrio sp. HDW18]|uniref:MarR family winged helix-turn-helix transcriptional regulator n=1 Tax=Vibrio sp. HDW18 TaxID=2714948 RepID=UPI001409F2B2|nr:MarR family transcriptional regulator [Vibrio sp. HDW18]QIL87097.1 MarR family transcriptional regulator [Vibrio sp. HDW18]
MSTSKLGHQAPDHNPLLLDNQVCFALYRASNAVIRAYRPLLDELDLTYSQYLVLLVLWQQNGINVKDLGVKLHLDSGTLTPLLKRLETKGMVERRRSRTDERVREMFLTPAGSELQQQARSVPHALLGKFDLSIDELVSLKSLCEKIMHGLD